MNRLTSFTLTALLLMPLASLHAAEPRPDQSSAPKRSDDPRPNLVFVFSDQQSSDMLGCYGNKQVISPNLDRLADQGVRFSHCISSAPICTPYRGMLLSGQHPLRNGAFENDVRMLPGDGKYFGEVLRDNGYRLGYYGKWHLYGGDRNRPVPPGPYRYGFDHEFLINNCTLDYSKERAFYWDADGKKQLYGDWEPYAQTRQAMQFIDQHAEKPFALFLSWHPPHNWAGGHEGYAAPEDCLKLYDPALVHLRANVADTPKTRKMYQGHMAMITSIDRAFGWLMEKLEEKGLANQTIVVFTSDHGDTLYSHRFAHNKMRPEQESIRVPLIMRYPPLLKPRTSELLVGSLDLMPTLLGMMKIPIPETCDGQNLTRAMAESQDDAVESVPLFLPPLNFRGVYTRRYTYSFDTSAGTPAQYRDMFFSTPKGVQWNCLYDRSTDPAETNNLFASPQQQEVREQLHQKTLNWMRRLGDQGLPYETVIKTVFTAEDLAFRQQKKWHDFTGILKGRPSELPVSIDKPVTNAAPAGMISEARVKELQNLRFGMFICWSFSTFSGKEWTPGVTNLDLFAAKDCDTDQWAKTAKEAGMGYILFLTKHHDGFCLWDTKTTDRKVTKSPLGRDVLAEVKKSCDKYGLKLALYFSEGEWAWPGGEPGQSWHSGHIGKNPEMKKAQLKELLTRYGPVEYIWFDHAVGNGGLSHPETAQWVKRFQPDCFVGFNSGPQQGADIRLGEMGHPAPLTDNAGAGFNSKNMIDANSHRLAEFTYPILPKHQGGASWFYSLPKHDNLCLSAENIYADYLGAVKLGNIYSLDVGPDHAGKLRDIDVKTLRQVGEMIRHSQKIDPPTKR